MVSDVDPHNAPVFTFNASDYDYGTQVKWSVSQSTGIYANVADAGSANGRVYWIAVDAGDGAPSAFDTDADENGLWTIGTGASAVNITQAYSASIAVSGGIGFASSGTVFSPLPIDGTLDIYAVFVSDTGNRSPITPTPQIANLVMTP